MDAYTRRDFDHSPMLVFYELTRACDLACVHCRADAQKACDPGELSPEHAKKLVDELLRFPPATAPSVDRRRSAETSGRVRAC